MIPALFLGIILTLVCGQQDGWKMTDRFYGFRYEIFGKPAGASADAMIEALTARAADSKCFGWAQKVAVKESVVGEVRCMKKAGSKFKDWLETYDDSSKQIMVYADTKIRLHFTYFKVLDEERSTCFLDAPHRCDDLPQTTSSSHAAGGSGHQEL
jgi:hypothetical protein